MNVSFFPSSESTLKARAQNGASGSHGIASRSFPDRAIASGGAASSGGREEVRDRVQERLYAFVPECRAKQNRKDRQAVVPRATAPFSLPV